MFILLWNFSAALRGYTRRYMPTNIAIDTLRTSPGMKWAIPVALVVTPAYLTAMAICIHLASRPGLGWLNLLVFLFYWNANKFALIGLLAPFALAARRLRRSRFVASQPVRI